MEIQTKAMLHFSSVKVSIGKVIKFQVEKKVPEGGFAAVKHIMGHFLPLRQHMG